MGLGLKEKQDLDPWRLGLRGQREGPSREESSVSKGNNGENPGPARGHEREGGKCHLLMSAVDQHFIFHCCNNSVEQFYSS